MGSCVFPHTHIHYNRPLCLFIELIPSFCLSVMSNWTDLTMEKVSHTVIPDHHHLSIEPKIKYYFPKDYTFDEVITHSHTVNQYLIFIFCYQDTRKQLPKFVFPNRYCK